MHTSEQGRGEIVCPLREADASRGFSCRQNLTRQATFHSICIGDCARHRILSVVSLLFLER